MGLVVGAPDATSLSPVDPFVVSLDEVGSPPLKCLAEPTPAKRPHQKDPETARKLATDRAKAEAGKAEAGGADDKGEGRINRFAPLWWEAPECNPFERAGRKEDVEWPRLSPLLKERHVNERKEYDPVDKKPRLVL